MRRWTDMRTSANPHGSHEYEAIAPLSIVLLKLNEELRGFLDESDEKREKGEERAR